MSIRLKAQIQSHNLHTLSCIQLTTAATLRGNKKLWIEMREKSGVVTEIAL